MHDLLDGGNLSETVLSTQDDGPIYFSYEGCCYGCSFKDELGIIWNDLKVPQFKYKIIDMVISGIHSISLVRKLRRCRRATKALVESPGPV